MVDERLSAELMRLLTEFGNRCYDCGQWRGDYDDEPPYEAVLADQQAAQSALIEYLVVHLGAGKWEDVK